MGTVLFFPEWKKENRPLIYQKEKTEPGQNFPERKEENENFKKNK